MSTPFTPVVGGSALPSDAPAAATQRDVPHRGGPANPSAEALRGKFGAAILRVDVVWGETTVIVEGSRVQEIVRWLHDDPSQRYEYLSDLTAVEFRDAEQPVEVVWHLRSIAFRRFLRLKVQLQRGQPLEVPSVWPVYKGADWLERECYDMFGIRFAGHPDLRRILMWEQYKEGFPLRKDFPLRGRFSRAEQLRQALAANPEARYSMEELSIADAFEDLPQEMRTRLRSGEKTGE
ncbi:MAG TPA: NADH-quinone oxidoreductase subunit C [Gemmatimonadaceae bacterium]|nr:NADH-quinone oxidoreductase subunit C [Gemmatimonadaceae bacterium]